jgi:ABC-type phosphate transport system substrate-binding protein
MRIFKRIQACVAGAILALAATTTTASADVVVIVSAKSPIATLDPDQVANIYLGKSANFPGNGEAVPLDLAMDSSTRNEFYAKATGKSPTLLKAYWSKLIFTGKGQPPKEVPDDAVVKKLVADNPKYIGYIDRNAVDPSVKVVLTVR